MGQNETEQRELLKEYLNQYYICKMKREQLEKRLKNIQREMNMPIGGKGYKPINTGMREIGQGAASFVYRMGEIETRIEEQKENMADGLLKIMDMLDFLDQNSTERTILELRYIDLMKWDGKDGIQHEMKRSRSSCFDYHDKALDELLKYKKVKMILKRFEEGRGKERLERK